MKKAINYTPTSVGPSKLDEVLAYCVDLDNVGKEKFCLLQDILKLGKYLCYREITPAGFYKLYDKSIEELEVMQHIMQAEYNTHTYRARVALNQSTQQR